MGVNISGSGILSGIASLVMGAVNNVVLLASKILGFTSVTTVDVQKHSIIGYNPYTPTYVSKKESPFSWQESAENQFNQLVYAGQKYLGKKQDGYFYHSNDMKTFSIMNFSMSTGSVNTPTTEDFNPQYAQICAGLPNGLFVLEYLYEFVENIGYSRELFVSNSSGSLFSIPGPTGYDSTPNGPSLSYLGTENGYDFFSTYINGTGKVFKTQITNNTLQNIVYQEVISAPNIEFFGSLTDKGVFYENGIYTLFGYDSSDNYRTKLYRSTDGTSFAYQDNQQGIVGSDYNFTLSRVNNKFIAVVDNWDAGLSSNILYSEDAITWTPVLTSGLSIPLYPGKNNRYSSRFGIVYINNKLHIAIIGTSSFVTSQDGVNWSVEEANLLLDDNTKYFVGNVTVSIDLAGGSSYYTTLVDSTGPGFILTSIWGGDFYVSNDKIINLLSSSDNLDSILTPISLPPSTGDAISGAFGQGKYVISLGPGTGNFAIIISDDNGKTWSTTEVSNGYFDMVYGNGKFVAVPLGTNGIVYSTDGISWYNASNVPSQSAVGNLIFDGTKFYAISGDNLLYSTNGETWTTQSINRTISFGPNLQKAMTLHNGSSLYAIATNNETNQKNICLIENNGLSVYDFANAIVPGNSNMLLSTGNELLAWGGGDGYIYVSGNNGYTWTASTEPLYPEKITYSDGIVIVNGTDFTGQNKKTYISNSPYLQYKSYDSTNWGNIIPGTVGSLVETQVSIGDQGSGTAEVLTPVVVLDNTSNSNIPINKLEITNNSTYDVLVDVMTQSAGYTGQLIPFINDREIPAGTTVTIPISVTLYPGEKLLALPSSVDSITVEVFGPA